MEMETELEDDAEEQSQGGSADDAAGSSASHAPGSSSNQHVTSAQKLHYPMGSSPLPPSAKAIEEALKARADALREVQGGKPPSTPGVTHSNLLQEQQQARVQTPQQTSIKAEPESTPSRGTPSVGGRGKQQQQLGGARLPAGALADQQQLLAQLQQQAGGQRPSAGALLLSSGMLHHEHLPFLVEFEARRLEQQAAQHAAAQQQQSQHQQHGRTVQSPARLGPPRPSAEGPQQQQQQQQVVGGTPAPHFSHAFSQGPPGFQNMPGPMAFQPFGHFGGTPLGLPPMAGQQHQGMQPQQQLPLQLLQSLPPQLRPPGPGLNGWPQPLLPQVFSGQQPLLPMPVSLFHT